MESRQTHVIGWREWVALPDLGVDAIKAKIDTGARTSALHVGDLRTFTREGVDMARFTIHPAQRRSAPTIEAEARLVDRRLVTSSSGHRRVRPVVVTVVELLGQRWPIELTLTSRDDMGFRMLLGRQAVRGRFLVNAGRSFLAGHELQPPGRGTGRKKHKPRRGTV